MTGPTAWGNWAGRSRAVRPSPGRTVLEPSPRSGGPGRVRVAHDKALVKHCPAIGTDDVLPAEDEEAVFRHYGLDYRPGAGGERQLARR